MELLRARSITGPTFLLLPPHNNSPTGCRHGDTRWTKSIQRTTKDFVYTFFHVGTECGQHDDRCGSRSEELEVSKCFPLYPHKRKSAPISNTSGLGHNRTHSRSSTHFRATT